MGTRNARGKKQPDNKVMRPDGESRWEPPPRAECIELAPTTWRLDSPGGAVVVMVQRYENQTWNLVHYAITLKYGENEIVRVDTEHSEVHRHQFYKNSGRKASRSHICWVLSQQDVQDTLESSVDDLADNAEEYLWRWKYGK